MAVVHSAPDSDSDAETSLSRGEDESAPRARTAKLAKSAKPAKAGAQKTGGISRTTVNFWLDTWLMLNLLAVVWIAFVLRFIFPRGTAAAGWTLWGYDYDAWAGAQFASIVALMLGVLVHVMLHWTWVCGVITGHLGRRDGKPVRWDDGTRTIVGVSLIVVLVNVLGLLMALAALMIRAKG